MGKLKVGRITLGMCNTNGYFIYREGSADEKGYTPVLFVDPPDQGDYIHRGMENNNFKVEAILLTHGHFDHIFGAHELRARSGCKIYASELEANVLADAKLNVSADVGRPTTLKVNTFLKDEEELEIANMKFKVISTPGHTEGGCCFYFEEDDVLIGGDTLFEGSVGRTDLPTGSMSALVNSIKTRLFVLPDTTVVYPGHGDSTTIGWEKKNNPYVV